MTMYGIAALVDFNLDAAYGHQAMFILGWSTHTARFDAPISYKAESDSEVKQAFRFPDFAR